MVFDTADQQRRALQRFGNAAELRVQRRTHGFVPQKRAAIFRGENQMDVNGGERLRHRLALWRNPVGVVNLFGEDPG